MSGVEQIVGRERRGRVSHHDWSGDACLNSRRRVNSTVGRIIYIRMYSAKDLQHNFEVEPLLKEFVTSAGGELVEDLISGTADFENADFLFRDDHVLIESKSLQEDFAIPEKLQNKTIELWKKWLGQGSVKFGHIFRPSELPYERQREMRRLYSEPIRRVLKKANRQLKTTAAKFGISDARNLLLIANDGLYSLEPDFIIATIAHLLQREFSGIHGFVYFTVNRYVRLPTDEYAHHLWVPAYSDNAPPNLPDFVNALGAKWFNFLGEKIGGWDGPRLRTDDLPVIRGVRHIK